MKKENIFNIPNFITLIRFILAFVLIYLFIKVKTEKDVLIILVVFIIGALTDFLDGQIARRFNLITKFGAKFDMISDRLLWIITGILLIIIFPAKGIFDGYHLFQLVLIMTREIVCSPLIIWNILTKRGIMVKAQLSGKMTTFIQGFAIPALILSVYYPIFKFSIILAIACFITGLWSFRDYSKQLGFFKK